MSVDLKVSDGECWLYSIQCFILNLVCEESVVSFSSSQVKRGRDGTFALIFLNSQHTYSFHTPTSLGGIIMNT